MQNPFKFGTLVDSPYFTDRVKELEYITHMLNSENHLILISPRRFGKSSLVKKAVNETQRPCISLNIQQVTCVEDFASMILKGVFKLHPWERLKHLLSNFRIIPTISANPVSERVEVTFQTSFNTNVLLEDVLNLLERVSTHDHKIIVVLDEFQEIIGLEKGIENKLRAIMQQQRNINYIFLGSQESMMTEIFEKKKSPFYHFGTLMRLDRIPYADFYAFVDERLKSVDRLGRHSEITKSILAITLCHPFYTQQLASRVWEILSYQEQEEDVVRQAVEQLVQVHDLDFERLWLTFNKTDKRIMQMLAQNTLPYENRSIPASTSYSSLKKLMKSGYVIRTGQYEIEDPFLKAWIAKKQG